MITRTAFRYTLVLFIYTTPFLGRSTRAAVDMNFVVKESLICRLDGHPMLFNTPVDRSSRLVMSSGLNV